MTNRILSKQDSASMKWTSGYEDCFLEDGRMIFDPSASNEIFCDMYPEY